MADSENVIESRPVKRDRGSVNDFHKLSLVFDTPSPVDIDDHRKVERDTDDGEDYWGRG